MRRPGYSAPFPGACRRARGQGGLQGVHDPQVVAVRGLAQDVQGLGRAHGRAVGPRPDHGAEAVGHAQDPGLYADLVPVQAVGVAAAVEAFVHLVDGLEDGELEVDLAQDVQRMVDVALHHELFLFGELVDLGQHGLVDEYLADLGQVGGELHCGLDLGGQARVVGQQRGYVAHQQRVPGQVRVHAAVWEMACRAPRP